VFPSIASPIISPGNPASLQLTTVSILAACNRTSTSTTDHNQIFSRVNFGFFGFFLGAEPRILSFYDYGGAAVRLSTKYVPPDGALHLYGLTLQSGVVNGSTFYMDGVACGNFTFTVVSQLNNWNVARGSGANSGLGGALLEYAMVGKAMAATEHARAYEDFLAEGPSADCCRKNFFVPRTGKTDAEYAAAGIVLDTVFDSQMVAGVRKIADNGPNNYVGDIVGTPQPQGDNGQLFKVGDRVNLPVITQLNAVQKFTYSEWFTGPPSTYTASDALFYWSVDGTHQLIVGYVTLTAGTSLLRVYVCDGNGLSYGTTAVTVVRAGCRQFLSVSFDGAGAADADKLKLRVDGDEYALNFGAAIPVATPNLAAAGLRLNYDFRNATTHNLIIKAGVADTTPQARAEYLKGAQRVVLRETLEDVPVTLGTSSTSLGPSIRVISGTHKISETADGKRWLECVTAGGVVMPLPPQTAFGTMTFWIWKALDANYFTFAFQSSIAALPNDGSQNGYSFVVGPSGRPGLYKLTGGASATLFYTNGAYAPVGTLYQITIARRPSDCRFSVYIKGGTYLTQTLISTVGGSGTNPIADPTYVVNSWLSTLLGPGDKLLGYDPANKNVALLTAWSGVLDPTQGEIP